MRHPVPWVNPSMCETSWDEKRHKTDEPYNESITGFTNPESTKPEFFHEIRHLFYLIGFSFQNQNNR